MRNNSILLVLPLLFPPQSPQSNSQGQDARAPTEDQIELCDFRVPGHVAEGNANFIVIYRLHFDSTGKPVEIEKVENRFLEDLPFEECFRLWRLPLRDEDVSVIMKWDHGLGWVSIGINGPTIHRSIRIASEFRNYPTTRSRKGSPPKKKRSN